MRVRDCRCGRPCTAAAVPTIFALVAADNRTVRNWKLYSSQQTAPEIAEPERVRDSCFVPIIAGALGAITINAVLRSVGQLRATTFSV